MRLTIVEKHCAGCGEPLFCAGEELPDVMFCQYCEMEREVRG